MGSLTILKTGIRRLRLDAPPRRILELGAGDASLLLRLAQTLKPPWPHVSLTVLDRHDLVTAETREAYEALGWHVTVLREDVLAWAAERNPPHFDLCVTSLFLHHFDAPALEQLLGAIATATDAFVACEPRRNSLAQIGSRLVGLLGSNRVTREDAIKSVAAGFNANEVTALWPKDQTDWICKEYSALPFTHCFIAVLSRVRNE